MSASDRSSLPGILRSLATGERRDAPEELLPLVYDELRRVARGMIERERPGQTLQPTALVHEAYLRLLGNEHGWDGRRHFFAAATEAMRRVLIDQARRKARHKHGGGMARVDEALDVPVCAPAENLVEVDDVLQKIESADPRLRELVNLRYFGGFTVAETAAVLGLSEATVTRDWRFVRAWLRTSLGD